MSSFGDARKIRQAIEAHRSRRYPQAERLYRELLSSSSQGVEALRGLGTLCLETNRPEEAETFLRRATTDPNAPAVCWLGLGNALVVRGKRAEAIDAVLSAASPNSRRP
jgi:predicted Zn-dependent protease